MPYAITALFTALLGLFYLLLSYRVVKQRRTLKVGLGAGGHEALQQAVRAHANFAEYVPLALLILFLLESSGLPNWSLYLYGSILTIARFLHGQGLGRSGGYSFGRFHGTLATWLLILTGSITLLVQYLLHW
ncbi:MAG: MAPEG family protein [Wenzhouxiangellaceae bacterium]